MLANHGIFTKGEILRREKKIADQIILLFLGSLHVPLKRKGFSSVEERRIHLDHVSSQWFDLV